LSVYHLSLVRSATIKGPARAILIVLADHANDAGECWLGHARIAKESGLGQSTVRKHLILMKAAGVIDWQERFTDAGDRDTNLYKINLGGGLPRSAPTPPRSGGVGHDVAGGGLPRSYKASVEASKETSLLQIDGSKENKDAQASSIYDAYPKKAGRKPAITAILKCLKKYPYEFLLENTSEYASAIGWKDPQFIPLPATWFNHERFNDDPVTWKSQTSSATQPKTRTNFTSNQLGI
jgi:hypothetical protein